MNFRRFAPWGLLTLQTVAILPVMIDVGLCTHSLLWIKIFCKVIVVSITAATATYYASAVVIANSLLLRKYHTTGAKWYVITLPEVYLRSVMS